MSDEDKRHPCLSVRQFQRSIAAQVDNAWPSARRAAARLRGHTPSPPSRATRGDGLGRRRPRIGSDPAVALTFACHLGAAWRRPIAYEWHLALP